MNFNNYRSRNFVKRRTEFWLILAGLIDVVIFAAPPQFRPLHFLEAVSNNKHAFLEKPVAVDPVGIRSVITTAKKAEAIGLCVVTGTQRRQIDSCANGTGEVIMGTEGYTNCVNTIWDLKGKVKWQFEYPKDDNRNPMNAVKILPYVQEHMHLGPVKIEFGPVNMVFETPIPGTPVTI